MATAKKSKTYTPKNGDLISLSHGKVRLYGRFLTENGNQYFLHNFHVMDGGRPTNMYGFKYSYFFGKVGEKIHANYNVKRILASTLARYGKMTLVATTKAPAKHKPVAPKREPVSTHGIKELLGWSVRGGSTQYSFGCGAVKLTPAEIKNFLVIYGTNAKAMEDYHKINKILQLRMGRTRLKDSELALVKRLVGSGQ